MDTLSGKQSPADKSPTGRDGVPLARRFTIAYVLAFAGFAAVAVWTIYSISTTLDSVDEATAELNAISTQATRLQTIADLADQMAAPDGAQDSTFLVPYAAVAESFRTTHLGLSAGTGSSGLDAPTGARAAIWDDGLRKRIDDLVLKVNALPGLMAADDEAAVESANQLIQQEAGAVSVAGDPTVAQQFEDAITVYTAELNTLVESQRSTNQLLLVAYIVLGLGGVFIVFRPLAHRIQLETTNLRTAEQEHRLNSERQIFRNQLNQALEVTDSEEEILERLATAMAEQLPSNPAELLLADSSNAHLRAVQDHPTAGSPNCPVDSPWGCAAIRRGTPITFETSRALNVCPKLTQHEGGACSAVCSPVVFMGRSLGVLHVIGDDLDPPDAITIERVNVMASEAGSRLGTMRATQQTELQASTDGLTGLPNRRSLESAARNFLDLGRPFAVAMADLDHFKDLNDTYGHEAGDKALRLFAKTLRSNLRPDDIAARYGGEEFVLLLPNTEMAEAKKTLDRLRVALAGDIAAAGSVPFTASWGLTSSSAADELEEMVQVADEALYAAKRAGRNRVIVGGVSGVDTPDHPVLTGWPEADTGGNGGPGGEAAIDLSDDGKKPAAAADGRAGISACEACGAGNPTGTRYCLTCGADVTASTTAD